MVVCRSSTRRNRQVRGVRASKARLENNKGEAALHLKRSSQKSAPALRTSVYYLISMLETAPGSSLTHPNACRLIGMIAIPVWIGTYKNTALQRSRNGRPVIPGHQPKKKAHRLQTSAYVDGNWTS